MLIFHSHLGGSVLGICFLRGALEGAVEGEKGEGGGSHSVKERLITKSSTVN